ncbi:MAG: hypothetical protein IT160_06465 [Bryobacterales bacterium]|nr:hypothetical protein [Bryobacterales bacterium]
MSSFFGFRRSLPVAFSLVLSASAVAAPLRSCATGTAVGAFDLAVKPDPAGAALPIRSVNRIEEGNQLIYRPVDLPSDEKKKAKVALVLLPPGDITDKSNITVLEAKPASKPAEWDVPMRVGSVALVYGPQGLETKKVTSLIEKDRELVAQLADYAEKTQTTEALIEALSQQGREPNATQNLDAAVRAFATGYGVSPNRLDRTQSPDQQAMLLIRTLNPAISAYDPLAPQPAARVQQSTAIAASVAGLFLGNGVGLAAGGAAMFVNMRSLMFPNTEFRSALVQPSKEGVLSLCAKKEAKSRTRLAYLWALRVPDLAPPSLALTAPVNVPQGLKSSIALKPTRPMIWKNVDRTRDWKLEPLASAAKPVAVRVRSSGDDTLEIDLTKAAVPAGNYRLAGDWDWTPFQVAGEISVYPLADLTTARLTPASQDQLIAGAGPVNLELTGPDFQFVEKMEIRKASERRAQPAPVLFDFDKGKRAGVQNRLTIELDPRNMQPTIYLLTMVQSDGKPQEVPLRVLPPSPLITDLPVRINLGEKQQEITLKGSGLDRIRKLSATGLEIELESNASSEHRKAVVRITDHPPVGSVLDLAMDVDGHNSPLPVKAAIRVAGPRPKIDLIEPSLPSDLTVALHKAELPAGYTVNFAMRLENVADQPRVNVNCREQDRTLRNLSLRPGEQNGTARVGSAGSGMLFLSLDPGDIGQTGCELQATVETDGEGRSDPKVLGKVVRLPKIDTLEVSGKKLDDTAYAGVLTGQDLETVAKAGWDPNVGLPVRGLPTPVAGDARRQVMNIAVPWPSPAPRSPLYVWLRGETEGRQTTVRY